MHFIEKILQLYIESIYNELFANLEIIEKLEKKAVLLEFIKPIEFSLSLIYYFVQKSHAKG